MEIKAIVFDIGGVLLEEHGKGSIDILVKKFGIDGEAFSEFVKKPLKESYEGRINGDEIFKMAKDELGISVSVNELVSAWLDARRQTSRINKEVKELVKSLKGKYVVASFTDTTKLNDIVRNELGVYDLFDFNVRSTETGFWKQEKGMHEFLLLRFKEKSINPGEIVFIDDDDFKLEPARSLGIRTILFENPEKLKKDLKSLGVEL